MSWLKRFVKKPKETQEEFEARIIEEAETLQNEIEAQIYAEFVVINFIAKWFALSKIVFYKNGKRQKNGEYFRWNVKPNRFQTAYELKYDYAVQAILNGEALIFDKNDTELLVADAGFDKVRKGVSEYTFSGIEKDGERIIDIKNSSDSLYIQYEQSDIRRRLYLLLQGMQELINTASDNYQITASQKGILEIESYEQGNNDFQKKVDDLLNNRFRQFFKSKKNSVMPLYRGFKYQDINNDRSSTKKSEISDINSLINEMISKAAIAHGVMPSSILGDKVEISQAEKASISRAVKPIAELLEEAINGSGIIGQKNFEKGYYCKVDLTPLTYQTIFDNAEAADLLIRSSQFSVDELREARGFEPLDTWWSDRCFGTKNYELLPISEEEARRMNGGEKQNGKSD